MYKESILGRYMKTADLEEAIKDTDTNPSDAQIEAGNYKKGKFWWNGLEISVENPKGSTRRGVDKDGNKWESRLYHTYGYIKGTVGRDKDHVDIFIGDNIESDKVYVINQVDPKSGKFDEHKVMIGFDSKEDAQSGYLKNYEKNWKGLGSIKEMSISGFKKWLTGDLIKKATLKEILFSRK